MHFSSVSRLFLFLWLAAGIFPLCGQEPTPAPATAPAAPPAPPAPTYPLAEAGALFGRLPLVDEINCGDAPGDRVFNESEKGVSKVESILGQDCRVLPNEGEAKYFAYRIGQGKGLQAGKAYLLTVEYPEDKGRAIFVLNRGSETPRGFHTGNTLGDAIYTFTNNNVESLQIPLSQKFETWKQLFYLHDRFAEINLPRGSGPRPGRPADGFTVIIAQTAAKSDPTSAGAAVSHIRLFEVPHPEKFDVKLHRPPADLPQRHLIFREEMADNVYGSKDSSDWGLEKPVDWFDYKVKIMRFLGMDTFGKDLLEFGHNQGWDTGDGKDGWFYRSKDPQGWEDIVTLLGTKYPGMQVMPYFEYTGSMGPTGLGKDKRAKPLSGQDTYTHIKWSEKGNADVTDPDTLADFNKILDHVVVRYKDKAKFLGAWLRPRPGGMPISYSDRCLSLFANQANDGSPVTRKILQKDPELQKKYVTWWQLKRRDFFIGVRDHLRETIDPQAVVIYTSDASEPGYSLPGTSVVTDDAATWQPIAATSEQSKITIADYAEVTKNDQHLAIQLAPHSTWGTWEWQSAVPQPDPEHYKDVDNIFMEFSFSNAFTVPSPQPFDTFRAKSGLVATRHYALNEGVLPKAVEYVACQMERAGPYSLLEKVRAVAYGDPTYLGALEGNTLSHGFPEYVRDFNAAFLALPALPSTILTGATATPDMVVRSIPTPKNGIYLLVANVGLAAQPKVSIKLPAKGTVTNAATGESVATSADGASLTVAMGPAQMKALLLQPAPPEEKKEAPATEKK